MTAAREEAHAAPWAIVLAAGQGRRFREAGGGDKLTHRLPDGRPMLLATVANVREGLRRAAEGPGIGGLVIVVREERRAELQALLDASSEADDRVAEVVVGLPASLPGLGDSLAAGARVVPPGLAALVMLADLPFVRPATIAAVAEALAQGAALVRPVNADSREPGHPVGFSGPHLEALREMSGGSGAGGYLQVNSGQVHLLSVKDGGISLDVDVQEDAGVDQ